MDHPPELTPPAAGADRLSATELSATSDFSALESVLGDEDRAFLASVRSFMREEVGPIINDFWSREELPHHLWPRFAELGLGGMAIEGHGCAGRGALVAEAER